MANVAFLGTGLLGSALAEAAAKRGDQVTVWNRTADKARALEQFDIHAAADPADAVRGATRVHLVLRDDPVVDEVIAALRPGLEPNAVIVDHTTNQPKLTGERSKRLNAEGVRYIHCPVFIGPAAARAGQGIILASGPRALFDAIHPALSRMAPRVEYLGERPELAAVYKLCGNAIIIGLSGIVADVFAIAGGSGVAPEDALRLLDFFNPAAIITGRGRNMAKRNFAPAFELVMARKDVRLMMESANGAPLITLPAIAARMDALIAEGLGGQDLGVIGKDAVPDPVRTAQ
jgi:3-hydroxyisobutyrate dehydrogenase-like beta-hydroxyacid dehydrogenase